MIYKYYIGTSDHWPGSTVYPQVDRFGRIRTLKVMQYDYTGHRVKDPITDKGHVYYLHKDKKYVQGDFSLSQCLFGEHLLAHNPVAPVAVFESEKTACMMSMIFNNCVCLATGGCGNFKSDVCEPLRGREVYLFPDNGKYEEWSEKGRMLTMCNQVVIADVMERRARNKGDDLADLIFCKDDLNADDWADYGFHLLYQK